MISRKNYFQKFFPLFVFAIAMGFLEAIVVVYIRELYYPEGFSFPLKALPPWLIGIEWIREITTLLMLGSVAWISGKSFLKRLGNFLFLFGIWDIFYYVALKLFLDWPETLLTWDILFLIPVTWVGPVLAPVVCSLLMILMALVFDFFEERNKISNLKTVELGLFFAGAAVVYYTFTVDFGMILLKGGFLKRFSTLATDTEFQQIITTWTPDKFNWGIFILGILIICTGVLLVFKRALSITNNI